VKYLEKNKDITEFSNFKTPTKARYFFEVVSRDDLDKLYDVYSWSKSQELPILFISGGTNMLFAFDIYD